MLSQSFTIHVAEPELVRPEDPTPHELKYLSNIDSQLGLRNHIPFAHIYRCQKGDTSIDPAGLIQHALSRALVCYYPLAGRLRHAGNGKLAVECTGEGVLFRDADADATIDQLRRNGDGFVVLPFEQWNRLLVDDVYGSFSVTDAPLLRLQVTRFSCGGFVSPTVSTTVYATPRALQFITSVANSLETPPSDPSVMPFWLRESLIPRTPRRISFPHSEYEIRKYDELYHPSDFQLYTQSSLFLPRHAISAIKKLAGAKASFDAVAALFWRSCARAIGLANTDIAHFLFPVDTRHIPGVSPRPDGYYGAAVVFPCVSVPANELCQKTPSYAALQIAKAKHLASQPEYRSSVIDYLEVHQGKAGFRGGKTAFVVSDQSKLGFSDVDFGWGQAVYGGPGRAGTGNEPGMVAAVVSHRLENGEEGLLLIFTMTKEAVCAFHSEVWNTVVEATDDKKQTVFTSNIAMSSL